MKTINIYGEIGKDGSVKAAQIVPMIDDTNDDIELRINSEGGEVFDGQAIAASVSRHGRVTARIDGVCASIATLIAVSAARVTMASGALLMIHMPAITTTGCAEDIRKEADLLDKITQQLISAYKERTAKDEKEILAAMKAETWYTAEEALKEGLIDAIEGRADIHAECGESKGAFSFGGAYSIVAKAEKAPLLSHASEGTPANLEGVLKAWRKCEDPEAQRALYDFEIMRREQDLEAEERRFMCCSGNMPHFSKPAPGVSNTPNSKKSLKLWADQ